MFEAASTLDLRFWPAWTQRVYVSALSRDRGILFDFFFSFVEINCYIQVRSGEVSVIWAKDIYLYSAAANVA